MNKRGEMEENGVNYQRNSEGERRQNENYYYYYYFPVEENNLGQTNKCPAFVRLPFVQLRKSETNRCCVET